MRFSAALVNHITANSNTYLMLKKIYTLHVKYNSCLFVNPLLFRSLNILNTTFLSKKITKIFPKTPRKLQHKTIKHSFFSSLNPYVFSQNQSHAQALTTSKTKSLQHRPTRQISKRQNKRTKMLLTRLLVVNKRVRSYVLTTNFNADLGTLRRYKLFQTPVYAQGRTTKSSDLVDSRKIFNFFLSVLKLYKRGPRKQSLLFLRTPLNTPRLVSTKLKHIYSPLNTSSNPITFTSLKTPRSPFKKVLLTRNKAVKKLNFFYHWTSERLNLSKSLQPFTQALILPKLPTKTPERVKEVYRLGKGFANQQSLTQLLTLQQPTFIETSWFAQKGGKSRFLVGTESTFSTTPMLFATISHSRSSVQERVNTLVQRFSFATTLTTKKFLSILISQTKLLSSRNIWENALSSTTNKKISPNQGLCRPGKIAGWSRYQNDDLYINTRLTHIRFKPGYARQWRVFRNEFRGVFNLSNRYQYRLTKYLAALSATQRLHQHKTQELLLKHGLVESKLAPNLETSAQYIIKGLTFLNGSPSSNPNLCLTQHDFIQLIVSLKYYTVVKWQTAQTLRNKSILAKLLWKRGKNWRRSKFTFPNWVMNFSTTFLDVPLYLEVDHFSLSAYVLTTNYPKPEGAQLYPKVLPLYNWKYII